MGEILLIIDYHKEPIATGQLQNVPGFNDVGREA